MKAYQTQDQARIPHNRHSDLPNASWKAHRIAHGKERRLTSEWFVRETCPDLVTTVTKMHPKLNSKINVHKCHPATLSPNLVKILLKKIRQGLSKLASVCTTMIRILICPISWRKNMSISSCLVHFMGEKWSRPSWLTIWYQVLALMTRIQENQCHHILSRANKTLVGIEKKIKSAKLLGLLSTTLNGRMNLVLPLSNLASDLASQNAKIMGRFLRLIRLQAHTIYSVISILETLHYQQTKYWIIEAKTPNSISESSLISKIRA